MAYQPVGADPATSEFPPDIEDRLAGLFAPKAAAVASRTDSYTAVLADSSSVVRMNKATAVTFTVPPNADVAFPIGTQILVTQQGAGQVTIAPGAGVTLRSRSSALKTAGQYACASLIKVATNEWIVSGDVVV